MATATDIITYIGIPLAVLGVLPILYTFALSILTQRRIRHLLILHGHKPHHTTRNNQEGFVLRASPMTSLTEVEMPRYTIAPVDRGDGRYWQVSEEAGPDEEGGLLGHGHGHGRGERHAVERVESTLSMLEEGRVRGFLRGGSWRTFHWRRLVVGRKLYRIQYEDELREPPAEIEFADLVNFLMDWGAELDGMGWEKLRSGGLWTPAGTVLLKVCDHDESDMESKNGGDRSGAGDWVLRTSMPDDSDGILTLCVRWPPGRNFGSTRSATSLPPGWGRLRKPEMSGDQDETLDGNKQTLSTTITTLTESNKHLLHITTLRFNLNSDSLVTTLRTETHNEETGSTLSLSRLSTHTLGPEWFTTTTSALLTLTNSNGALWGFEPPSEITNFTRKDSIPCGVLVLLDLLPADQAPHWESTNVGLIGDDRDLAAMHHKRFQARLQAERLEATMPPEQARVHRMNREMEERRSLSEGMMRHLEAKKERQRKRVQDAVVSPRVGNRVVAERCLAWLVERGFVESGRTVLEVAEGVLWLIVLQAQSWEEKEEGGGGGGGGGEERETTMPVLKVLEQWTGWAVAGGMKREQVEMLEKYKKDFCYAACLVEVVREAASVSTWKGKASVDMLECLRLWRKVRLG